MSEQNNDAFDAKLDRIAEQVDAIAHFVGRTTELQMQTQIKLDEIAEIDRRTNARLDRMSEAFDQKFDRISDEISNITATIREQSAAINGYQDIAREQARSTAEWIKLVTLLTSKAL